MGLRLGGDACTTSGTAGSSMGGSTSTSTTARPTGAVGSSDLSPEAGRQRNSEGAPDQRDSDMAQGLFSGVGVDIGPMVSLSDGEVAQEGAGHRPKKRNRKHDHAKPNRKRKRPTKTLVFSLAQDQQD